MTDMPPNTPRPIGRTDTDFPGIVNGDSDAAADAVVLVSSAAVPGIFDDDDATVLVTAEVVSICVGATVTGDEA